MEEKNLIDVIKEVLRFHDGKWKEKKDVWDYSTTIAERKAFLLNKKLTYTLKIRIDESGKAAKFSEMLIEAGTGFSSGGDLESGITTGLGFKTESYNTLSGTRQGTIGEQSKLFENEYSYHFDYSEIRTKIQEVVEKSGYQFEYQILPVK
jgi:hypothetical protein